MAAISFFPSCMHMLLFTSTSRVYLPFLWIWLGYSDLLDQSIIEYSRGNILEAQRLGHKKLCSFCLCLLDPCWEDHTSFGDRHSTQQSTRTASHESKPFWTPSLFEPSHGCNHLLQLQERLRERTDVSVNSPQTISVPIQSTNPAHTTMSVHIESTGPVHK